MNYFAITDIGRKYDHNEDFYALPEPNEKLAVQAEDIIQKGSLFVLCDGVGGLNAGEVASELTATWILRDYYATEGRNDLPDRLKTVIKAVNDRIYKLAHEHENYYGMGTTLVAVLFLNGKAHIFSVGDSRVYVLKNKVLIQLTEDQSEVWPLYKSGQISKDDLRHHPRNNIITSAVGIEKEVDLQYLEYAYGKKEKFLLCSDGLSDMTGDSDLRNILIRRQPLKKTVKKLVDTANENGGKDNITAIVIKI